MGPRINTPHTGVAALPLPMEKNCCFINRKKSYGGSDLWMVQKTSEDKWGAVANLGPVINTQVRKVSLLHSDGKTLYFRSMDIPVWEALISLCRNGTIKKKWSEPVNLGYLSTVKGMRAAWPLIILGKIAYYASDAQPPWGNTERNLDLSTV